MLACVTTVTGSAPSDLSELLHLYSPSHSLRSSSDTQTLKLQRFNRKTHGFCTLTHLEQSPPSHQALCYSLFLQKQTHDISLLRTFQLSIVIHHPYQSVQCACVRACVRVRVCIFCIVMLEPLSTLCVSCFFCVCALLFFLHTFF